MDNRRLFGSIYSRNERHFRQPVTESITVSEVKQFTNGHIFGFIGPVTRQIWFPKELSEIFARLVLLGIHLRQPVTGSIDCKESREHATNLQSGLIGSLISHPKK